MLVITIINKANNRQLQCSLVLIFKKYPSVLNIIGNILELAYLFTVIAAGLTASIANV